ncbi:hypothetical protein T069G_02035 [Trichoderma breve]|uniref:Uncharacterized protein n=1 Tax=Trichoderma breve TaxID=2034170 RepID=A0A9W9EF39_9HYPO|nr:hypothetical protein T069G_02035 [Trichoderma breve]KAJ4865505.1 hypothetical protein T069G_02035 [Trichoderma breve]
MLHQRSTSTPAATSISTLVATSTFRALTPSCNGHQHINSSSNNVNIHQGRSNTNTNTNTTTNTNMSSDNFQWGFSLENAWEEASK